MTDQLYFTLNGDNEFRENLLSISSTYYPKVGEVIDIGNSKYIILKREFFANKEQVVYTVEMIEH